MQHQNNAPSRPLTLGAVDRLTVALYPLQQVPGFTCINSGIGPTFSTFNGLIDATTAGTFGKVAKLSFGVTGGVYNFNFTTTGNVGIMLTPRPFSDGSWPGTSVACLQGNKL